MTTMISEVYAAFISAGVPEAEARKAAEVLSEDSVATKGDVANLQRELAVVKWMLGIVIAAQIIPLLRSLNLF